MELAAQNEKKRDWDTAQANYENARTFDPSLAGLVANALARIRTERVNEGTDAMKRARQYDALNRVDDAVAWYERAFRSLPDDHPDKQTAGNRLRVLKSSR
jgi:tetratricopeptide (TPR) repeat protein